MATVPQQLIAPTVSQEQLTALHNSVAGFDRDQLIWSSGFLAGLAGTAGMAVAPSVPLPGQDKDAEPASWQVLYATETGNSRGVAESLVARARQAGLRAEATNLRDLRPKNLARYEQAVFVIATHGVGEAPEGSEAFFDFWLSDKAPRLESLRYSVLALGDSSYADFCEMGRRLDARLSELGARRVVERSDCDLDFDDNAEAWTLKILETAQADAAPARGTHLHSVSPTPIFTRRNPFRAEILTRQRITGRDSSKDVRHVELDLEGSGLRYTPGDSLGVIARNPPQVVEAVIDVLGFDGDTAVGVSGQQMSLREALASRKEITRLSRPVLEAAASGQPRLQALLADRGRLAEYFNTRQLIDFIAEFEVPGNPGAFVGGLRTLTPRLYSIASSSDANPDEAHLTVAVVDYDAFGRRHLGAASNFLVGGITHAPVYVEHNEHFRLPADGNTPIAMIGAGTGVAPYRAFIEHRREHGHTGDNWLLFGDRTLANDFLYQIEWLRYRKDGLLTQLDVAFSRDQAEKIYVQHRMLRRGRQLFDWLERGAHVYVCGDAEHMAGDVHDALLAIVREHGGLSSDRATEYLGELKKARRYQRDVY